MAARSGTPTGVFFAVPAVRTDHMREKSELLVLLCASISAHRPRLGPRQYALTVAPVKCQTGSSEAALAAVAVCTLPSRKSVVL